MTIQFIERGRPLGQPVQSDKGMEAGDVVRIGAKVYRVIAIPQTRTTFRQSGTKLVADDGVEAHVVELDCPRFDTRRTGRREEYRS